MPKVGSKEFPFTRQGIAEAKQEARTTGQPIKARKTYAETAHTQAERAKAGVAHKKTLAGGQAVKDGHGAVPGPLGGVTAEGSPAEEKTESGSYERKEDAAGQPKPVNNLPGATNGKRDPSKSLGGSGVTIKDAIKHPGALTEKANAAGQSIDEFARAHQHDGDQTGQQARFYLGVLKKAGK